MDLLRTYTVVKGKLPPHSDTLTYFVNTMYGRKIMVAVITQTKGEEAACETSDEWKHFLRASGCNQFLPKKFRSKDDIEQKLSHFLHPCTPKPLIAACSGGQTYHFPDVLSFTLVWFKLDIPDIENDTIPGCMRRHLFEHTGPYARLLYGATSWTVKVDNYCFTDGFAELLVENNVEFGSCALLRHVGNFIFEIYMFDKQGYSLNLATAPVVCSNPLYTPDDFLVYVESSFEDIPYGQLYDPPSYLYVPKTNPQEWCEGFLRSCSDLRRCVRIYYGKEDACFITGERPILQKIQNTFELKRNSTLFFIAHGRGGALLLVISKCGVEELPKETNTYEIRTAARGNAAAILQ